MFFSSLVNIGKKQFKFSSNICLETSEKIDMEACTPNFSFSLKQERIYFEINTTEKIPAIPSWDKIKQAALMSLFFCFGVMRREMY